MANTKGVSVSIALCVLTLGFQAPTLAQDGWAAAVAQAEAFEESAAGKPFVASVEKAFEKEQSPTFSTCAKEVRRPDLADFALLMEVGGDGVVTGALARPGTNLAMCMCGKLKGWKVSPPPQAGVWVKIEVHLKPK